MRKANIYLGGFMAAGKTSVGRSLACSMDRPFIDTDEVIERRAGKSISTIFSEEGEPFFRSLERSLLEELVRIRGVVISLGGGILAKEELRRMIMDSGILVVLSVQPETVMERVRSEAGKRPLLEKEDLRSLWERRLPSYEEAHLKVRSDDRTVEDISGEIMGLLQLLPSGRSSPLTCLNCSAGNSSYPVMIGKGILSSFQDDLDRDWDSALLVVDGLTGVLYGDQVSRRKGEHILPRGEEAKTRESLWSLYSSLQGNGIDRSGTMVALGGGTVGDVSGFAAATWMRGIDYVQCPTTLLAQVDSSIGGKTGINLPWGKNLVGSFHQPLAVISDINCLQTLPEDEFRQGLGEVLKYALGEDQGLLSWLEDNLQGIREREFSVLQEMVAWCARIKMDIVARDEKENTGERARLNLGHTIGHALEGASSYTGWKHGDAVAFGTLLMGSLSVEKGCLDPGIQERFRSLYRELAFQRGPLSPWKDLLPFLKRDKKFRASKARLILPVTGSHSSVVDDVPLSELKKIYEKVIA